MVFFYLLPTTAIKNPSSGDVHIIGTFTNTTFRFDNSKYCIANGSTFKMNHFVINASTKQFGSLKPSGDTTWNTNELYRDFIVIGILD